MANNKYFKDELAFLREQGASFSKLNPHLSRFLQSSNTDPDIERLLEGFAFLTARLREKIEDDFPELSHSLLEILMPNYLRVLPSVAIVKFSPLDQILSGKEVIASQTQLDSVAINGTSCHFRTCRDVEIYPLRLTKVKLKNTAMSSVIDLQIQILVEQSLSSLNLQKLTFYLGEQEYSAQMLYLWINEHLERCELVCGDHVSVIDSKNIKNLGFDEQDALLPNCQYLHEGYRILQEYLLYPQSFLFVELSNLICYLPQDLDQINQNFQIRFIFTKPLATDILIKDDSFSLFCSPIINLFTQDAKPIELTGKKVEYALIPEANITEHYEIFSIDKVSGFICGEQSKTGDKLRKYTSFTNFAHSLEKNNLYYQTKIKVGMQDECFDHTIAFMRDDEIKCIGKREVISIALTSTNRNLVTKLGIGDINQATSTSPSFVSFTNITEPTVPVRPPLNDGLLLTLIANLSLNYLSLLKPEALISIVNTYDLRAINNRQIQLASHNRAKSIIAISSKVVDRLYKGLIVRGVQTTLTLDQTYFRSEGDLYLFSSVLNRFLGLYTHINSFHELIVINHTNQERYKWDKIDGMKDLM